MAESKVEFKATGTVAELEQYCYFVRLRNREGCYSLGKKKLRDFSPQKRGVRLDFTIVLLLPPVRYQLQGWILQTYYIIHP